MMFRTKEQYRSMSDYFLEYSYRCDLEDKDYYLKILKIDLTEDIAFIQEEIRKRKLKRLELYLKFSSELKVLDNLQAPQGYKEKLLRCKNKKDAASIVDDAKRIHSIDPFWEENWPEKYY